MSWEHIVIALVLFAIQGGIGWAFRRALLSYDREIEALKAALSDVEKRVRALESGGHLKGIEATLIDVRERLVRIETQLAAERRRE